MGGTDLGWCANAEPARGVVRTAGDRRRAQEAAGPVPARSGRGARAARPGPAPPCQDRPPAPRDAHAHIPLVTDARRPTYPAPDGPDPRHTAGRPPAPASTRRTPVPSHATPAGGPLPLRHTAGRPPPGPPDRPRHSSRRAEPAPRPQGGPAHPWRGPNRAHRGPGRHAHEGIRRRATTRPPPPRPRDSRGAAGGTPAATRERARTTVGARRAGTARPAALEPGRTRVTGGRVADASGRDVPTRCGQPRTIRC